MGMELQTRNETQAVEAYRPEDILHQVGLIQNVMKTAMKRDTHFGTVPGCGDKPTLLKPGAEKLLFLFRYGTTVEQTVVDLGRGHREYQVKVTVFKQSDSTKIGEGVGSCSTLEGKYRFRSENTGKPVPSAYWDSKDPSLLGGPTFKARKVDGKWFIYQQVEHDNPADYYNTCLKMAKKRAMVDATITSTAASDIFTQDIEDINENLRSYGVVDSEVVNEDNASFEAAEAPKRPVETPKPPKASYTPPPSHEAQGTAPSGGWRDVKIHFGKNNGTALGSLNDKSLWWFIKEWEPGDWPKGSGKFKQVDLDLRMALNQAEAELRVDKDVDDIDMSAPAEVVQ